MACERDCRSEKMGQEATIGHYCPSEYDPKARPAGGWNQGKY